MLNFSDKENKLIEATNNYDLEMVTLFLKDKSFDPTFNNYLILKVAIKYRLFDIVKILIKDKRFKAEFNDFLGLKISAFYNHEDIFFYLVENSENINFNVDENYLLKAAIKNNNFKIIKFLLNNPSFIQNFGDKKIKSNAEDSLLCKVVKTGDIELFKLVIKYDDIISEAKLTKNDKYLHFNIAIQLAAELGYFYIFKSLFYHKRCDPYFDNLKALENAINKGEPYIGKLFFNIENFDPSKNKNLLFNAINHGNIFFVEELIKYENVINSVVKSVTENIKTNPIEYSNKYKQDKILKILWSVEKFRGLLRNKNPKLFIDIEKEITLKKIHNF